MTDPKPINLALQGGGAHGAFTWGVLDALLADERVVIEALSGTSAGAMNAVVLAEGLERGGKEAAREALHDFWFAVSEAGRTSPIQRSPFNVLLGDWSLDNSPTYLMFDLLSRIASPYDMNPLNLNPLKDLLERKVSFERVRRCDKVKLFISATNVETGRAKVFERGELTADMVMASACLPFMFQAVEIDGVPYWDGGYMGNPVLYPFFSRCLSNDIVVVQINPILRPGAPKTAHGILNRVNEITFNASLLREYRAIDFVTRLLDQGHLDPEHYHRMLLHRIEAEEDLNPLGSSSKMNAEWPFLEHLFAVGQRAATAWLDRNHAAIGQRTTLDLRAMFQG